MKHAIGGGLNIKLRQRKRTQPLQHSNIRWGTSEWKTDMLDKAYTQLTYLFKNRNLERVSKHPELCILCSSVSYDV